MNKKRNVVLYWILAIVITLGTAVYQRMTGPTYPKRITFEIGNQEYNLKLPRSYGGAGDCPVELAIPDEGVSGAIVYRRYPSSEDWKSIPMKREGELLTTTLPHQPPAGKIAYYIMLKDADGKEIKIPDEEEPVVIRYKGAVPDYVLGPHIFFMFFAMLLSNLTGLLALAGFSRQVLYGRITLVLLIIGGMILGPLVQKYAFGELWTGVPFGWDLTDNKTLIAFVFWMVAVLGNWKKERPWLTVLAAVMLMLVYMIPHSLYGSELDHESGKVIQGMIMSTGVFY